MKEEKFLVDTSYELQDLEPLISAETMEMHYSGLYKGYVDRINSGESGDFVEGGEQLHALYFSQLLNPEEYLPMSSRMREFIDSHFDSFSDFSRRMTEMSSEFQGSGWVYLSTSGTIKKIVNHEPRTDVALIFDCWEHAWILDYQNKKQHFQSLWSLINWSIIEERIFK